MSTNRVVLIGRMTRDAELRTTTTGKSVADFSIAVQKRIKPTDGSPDADFFRITAWGQQAEFVTEYLGKGRLVAVDGRLTSRKYTDKEGTNRELVEVVADNVQGLDRARDEDDQPTVRPWRETVAAGSVPSADEYDPFGDD